MSPINAPDVSEIESAIAEFARSPNGGLVVALGGTAIHRNEIIAPAAKHRLPAVYSYSYFVRSGGLDSYGPDTLDQYRRAADYIDRIFKGEKPADLPVQTPTKYNLAINLKTAQSLRFSPCRTRCHARRRGDPIAVLFAALHQCPLLAQSGHGLVHRTCPLSGVKRTYLFALHMSADASAGSFQDLFGLHLQMVD